MYYKMSSSKKIKKLIGWREWVSLPSLDIDLIKVKVDTGARTSALHAEDIETYTRHGKHYVRFTVLPKQKSRKPALRVHAPLVEKRHVKSSVGTTTYRPVILVNVKIGNELFPMELTLVNRDVMGFRMLIGRQGIRNKFIVDPGESFITRKIKK